MCQQYEIDPLRIEWKAAIVQFLHRLGSLELPPIDLEAPARVLDREAGAGDRAGRGRGT